jgi:hypothetical protein
MFTRPFSRRSLAGSLAAAVSGFVCLGAAFAGSYRVSVIPPPSGMSAIDSMSGINNSGQAAGAVQTLQGFIGSLGGSILIPGAGLAYAINDSGQVVGVASIGGTARAYIGTVSGITPIPGVVGAVAYAINNSGLVAGLEGQPIPRAFISSGSGIPVILLPSGWASSAASGINAFGQITGIVDGDLGFDDQPFVGTSSGLTVIPLPAGWTLADSYAINDSGQIAGMGCQIFGCTPNQAFWGTIAGITAIPRPLGATTAQVTYGCLNNSGVIVGQSDVGGWIWCASGGTQLLNTMVPSGWKISNAISVSQNGLILAQGKLNGGASQFVELIPTAATTPAPGTGFLVMLGLLLVLGWCYRIRSVA